MSESIGQRVARAAWMAMNGDKAWAEMAWNDMGGAEPTWERANLEIAVEEALGTDFIAEVRKAEREAIMGMLSWFHPYEVFATPQAREDVLESIRNGEHLREKS